MHAPGDAGLVQAWHATVTPDDVRGLLHLRATRFVEIATAACARDSARGVLEDIDLAHVVLFEALRPRIDGGALVALLADRLGIRREPAPLVSGLDRAVRDLGRWMLRTLHESATAMRYGPVPAPEGLGTLRGLVLMDSNGQVDIAQLSTADLRRHPSWLRAELADIRARGLTRLEQVITSADDPPTPYLETWPTVRCVHDPASPS